MNPQPSWSEPSIEPNETIPPQPSQPTTPAGPPMATPPPPRPARRRAGPIASILGASVLSAALASGATVFIVRQTTPAVTAAPVTATTASTSSASASSSKAEAVDLAQIVAAAKASVVTITADGISTSRFSPFGRAVEGIGSGIILTADGYILTNRHVVEGSSSLTVELEDGRTLPAAIVKESDTTDLALIKVDATGLSAASIGSSVALEVGQTALAIGSPLGTYTETVTRGIVSGLGREVTVGDQLTRRQTTLTNLIQTDAAINAGNSGGPLLDAGGNVLGINTAVSTNAQGIGFAIPIDAAADLIALTHAAPSA